MQDLRKLSDAELISETEVLVLKERELLLDILNHLREIERRRLFGAYSSLFAYAVGHLKYSEQAAYRRIEAMKVYRELPEIESSIASGEVNLTHIGIAQTLFMHEKKNGRAFKRSKKIEVFEKIAGQPTRKAQKIAAEFAPEPIPHRDQVKGIADGRNLATIELSDETLAKVQKLKGLLAHKHPHLTMDELLSMVCDLALEQWNPAREPKRKTKEGTKASVKRGIWKRDQGICTKCGSEFFIQADHIDPDARGGEYTLENMRLLCCNCNQRAAIKEFGLEKMDPFLSPSAPKVEEDELH